MVEEPVHHPHLERCSWVPRDEEHGAGVVDREVLDDDARLDDGAAAVDEHGHPLERPERRELRRGLLVAELEQAKLERRVVLVERDENLLTVRRERMGEELHTHPVIQ